MHQLKQKKKLIFYTLSILTVCVLLIVFTTNSIYADVGNHVRHSSGRSYSSHSHHYGSSYSGHSSDFSDGMIFGMLSQFLFMGFSFNPFFGILWWIILGFIAKVVFSKFIKSDFLKNVDSHIQNPQANYEPSPNEIDLTPLYALDPNFDRQNFISYSKEVFIELQDAWTEKDWEIARQFESQQLYNTHAKQMQEYIKNKTTNIVENISILDTRLHTLEITNTTTYLSVLLTAVFNDYVVDDDTKKIIAGSQDIDVQMTYILTFKRSNNVQTTIDSSNQSAINCPSCGAPMGINENGRCDYCGNIIINGDHGWVLNDLSSVN